MLALYAIAFNSIVDHHDLHDEIDKLRFVIFQFYSRSSGAHNNRAEEDTLSDTFNSIVDHRNGIGEEMIGEIKMTFQFYSRSSMYLY